MSLDQALSSALDQRKEQSRLRKLHIQQNPSGRLAQIDGQELLNFSSNDYLGLANHRKVVDAFQKAAEEFGVGSGASHLVCGHNVYHHKLEMALAKAAGRERALLFSTGYMANMAVISTLTGRDDEIFQDRLNHASLLDGAMLSRAKVSRYRHGDVADLNKQLEKSSARRKLVVTDGVFSMDGDVAPLDGLIDCCEKQNAWLFVDDAHGFGVLGKNGTGICEGKAIDVLMATLSKSIGCFGAFVAGSDTLIQTLVQFARPYIYTTAMPPAVAAAALASLELLSEESWRRDKLKQHIERFRKGASELGFELMPSQTAIQPLVVGDDSAALALSNKLKEKGLLVVAIRPPTVPVGQARLRITFSAAHQQEDVDQLLAALGECRSLVKEMVRT